jgi:hypothetical protein
VTFGRKIYEKGNGKIIKKKKQRRKIKGGLKFQCRKYVKSGKNMTMAA